MNPRSAFVAAAAFASLFICARAARADNQPQNLLKALATYPPSMQMGDYGPPHLGQQSPDAGDRRSGIVGTAIIGYGGPSPKTVQIHYVVFETEDQASQYATTYAQQVNSSAQPKLFSSQPDATCSKSARWMQVCGIARANVFVLAISLSPGNPHSNTDEPFTGVRAANVLVFALKNLRRVSMEIGPLGENTPAPAVSAPPNPCSLLTSADAAAIMRSPVMRPRDDPYTKTCYYNAQSPMAAGDGVGLQLLDGGRSKFDFDHQRISYTKPLSGVGEEAFEFVSAAGFVQVYVLKGSQYFSVTLTNRNDRNVARSAAELARQIASRLPG